MADEPDPVECNSCHFPFPPGTKLHEVAAEPVFKKRGGRYCDLCYCTLAGNIHGMPDVYQDGAGTMAQIICYVGNAILKAIQERHIQTADVPKATWKCPDCGQANDPEAKRCWRCASKKPS